MRAAYALALTLLCSIPAQAGLDSDYSFEGTSRIRKVMNPDGSFRFQKKTTDFTVEAGLVIKTIERSWVNARMINDAIVDDEPVQDHGLDIYAYNREKSSARVDKILERDADYTLDGIDLRITADGIFTSPKLWTPGVSTRWYNVETGKFIMAYSSLPLAGRKGPDEQKTLKVANYDSGTNEAINARFLGVLSGESFRDFRALPDTEAGMKHSFQLTYSSMQGPQQKLALVGPEWQDGSDFRLVDTTGTGKNAMSLEEIYAMDLGASADEKDAKKALSGFALEFNIQTATGKQKVSIPFESDHAILEKAELPAGYQLIETMRAQ